jgi:hypothetical protein
MKSVLSVLLLFGLVSTKGFAAYVVDSAFFNFRTIENNGKKLNIDLDDGLGPFGKTSRKITDGSKEVFSGDLVINEIDDQTGATRKTTIRNARLVLSYQKSTSSFEMNGISWNYQMQLENVSGKTLADLRAPFHGELDLGGLLDGKYKMDLVNDAGIILSDRDTAVGLGTGYGKADVKGVFSITSEAVKVWVEENGKSRVTRLEEIEGFGLD